MAPNSERYDYTHKTSKLCDKKPQEEVTGHTIYDVLRTDIKFSKTLKMVQLSNMKNVLQSGGDGYTMFVTEDKNIPDEWMKDLDTFRSQNFLNSYIVMGQADKEYLLKNGSSIYIPRKYHYNNPILAVVDSGDVYINKVGKILYEIEASNGYILVLDNIAEITYIN